MLDRFTHPVRRAAPCRHQPRREIGQRSNLRLDRMIRRWGFWRDLWALRSVARNSPARFTLLNLISAPCPPDSAPESHR
jgi:hypothetical protein